jgi:hypothetical protein
VRKCQNTPTSLVILTEIFDTNVRLPSMALVLKKLRAQFFWHAGCFATDGLAFFAVMPMSVNDRREGSHQWKPPNNGSVHIYRGFAMFRPVKNTAAKPVRMRGRGPLRLRAGATT